MRLSKNEGNSAESDLTPHNAAAAAEHFTGTPSADTKITGSRVEPIADIR